MHVDIDRVRSQAKASVQPNPAKLALFSCSYLRLGRQASTPSGESERRASHLLAAHLQLSEHVSHRPVPTHGAQVLGGVLAVHEHLVLLLDADAIDKNKGAGGGHGSQSNPGVTTAATKKPI